MILLIVLTEYFVQNPILPRNPYLNIYYLKRSLTKQSCFQYAVAQDTNISVGTRYSSARYLIQWLSEATKKGTIKYQIYVLRWYEFPITAYLNNRYNNTVINMKLRLLFERARHSMERIHVRWFNKLLHLAL